jgi:hypothetical protein
VSFRVTLVGDSGPLRSSAAREAVVRPLARAAERSCVRPGCPAPAQASLTFRYASREAWLERLTAEPTPEAYDLCSSHAARTQPPHGWQLRDRRPREEQLPQQEPPPRRDLGGEDTVAVLAAALRAVPEPARDDAGGGGEAPAPSYETARPSGDGSSAATPRDASGAGGTETALEETASPVLESVGVPRLFAPPVPVSDDEPEVDAADAVDAPRASDPVEEDAGDGDPPGGTAAPHAQPAPRPVPAARARGIAPPANRSVRAPHGTALDW